MTRPLPTRDAPPAGRSSGRSRQPASAALTSCRSAGIPAGRKQSRGQLGHGRGVLVEHLGAWPRCPRLAFEAERLTSSSRRRPTSGGAGRAGRARLEPANRRFRPARATRPSVFAPATAAPRTSPDRASRIRRRCSSRRAPARRGARRARRGRNAHGCRPRSVPNGVRTPDMVDGRGRHDARVRRRRARRAPASLTTPSSTARPSHEADERRRRDPPLPRGGGRRGRLRAPRRRDPPDLRRVRARDDRAPRPRPARAGRRPHGRGLRAGLGRLGVAIATSGPGATNLVTPIADAWMDSTPLVCITGQVRTHLIGTDAFQECDITGITIPIVKHSWLVQDVEELPHVLKAAFHVARTGRCGPGARRRPTRHPGGGSSTSRTRTRSTCPAGSRRTQAHPRQIREAARAHRRGGEGPCSTSAAARSTPRRARSSGQLAEAGRLPVITTLMAKGAFPESHELHFGWPGMHGPSGRTGRMNKCDLLVAVGARFDDRVTGKLSAFAPGAKVVHLDVDAAEIGKLRAGRHPGGRPAQAGARRARARGARLREDGRNARTEPWLRQLDAWRDEFPLATARGGDTLEPQLVLETLQALTAGATTSSGRPASGSTRCGRCSTSSATGRARSSPPAVSARWATACRLRSARRPPGRRDGRLRRRRRLLPDDVPGARDRGARRASRSSSWS